MDYSTSLQKLKRHYFCCVARVGILLMPVVVFSWNPAVSIGIHRYKQSDQLQREQHNAQSPKKILLSVENEGLSSLHVESTAQELHWRKDLQQQVRRNPRMNTGVNFALREASQHQESPSESSRFSDTGPSSPSHRVSSAQWRKAPEGRETPSIQSHFQNERANSNVSPSFAVLRHRHELRSVRSHTHHKATNGLKDLDSLRLFSSKRKAADVSLGIHTILLSSHPHDATDAQSTTHRVPPALPGAAQRGTSIEAEPRRRDGRETDTTANAHANISTDENVAGAIQAERALVVEGDDPHGDTASEKASATERSATGAPGELSTRTGMQEVTSTGLFTSRRRVRSDKERLSSPFHRTGIVTMSLQQQGAARVALSRDAASESETAMGVPARPSAFAALAARSSEGAGVTRAAPSAAAAGNTVAAIVPSSVRAAISSSLYSLPSTISADTQGLQSSPDGFPLLSTSSSTAATEEAAATPPYTPILLLRAAPDNAMAPVPASTSEAAGPTMTAENPPTAAPPAEPPVTSDQSPDGVNDPSRATSAAPIALAAIPSLPSTSLPGPAPPPISGPTAAPLISPSITAIPDAVSGVTHFPAATLSTTASSSIPPGPIAGRSVPLGTPKRPLSTPSSPAPATVLPAIPVSPAAVVPLTAAAGPAAAGPLTAATGPAAAGPLTAAADPAATVPLAATPDPAAAGPLGAVAVPAAGAPLAATTPSAGALSSAAAVPPATAAIPAAPPGAATPVAAIYGPTSGIHASPEDAAFATAPSPDIAPLASNAAPPASTAVPPADTAVAPAGTAAPPADTAAPPADIAAPPADYADPASADTAAAHADTAAPPADTAAPRNAPFPVDATPSPDIVPTPELDASDVVGTAAGHVSAHTAAALADKPSAARVVEKDNEFRADYDILEKEIKKHRKAGEACFDACSCWPVWSLGIVLLILNLTASFVAFYRSASLFSRGLLSSQFYRGGGYWLLGVAALGFTTGGLIGALVPPACWAGALYLGGFLVSLFLSFVLLGRRGALLGSFGGIGAGGVIGFFTETGLMGIVIGMMLGLLIGIVIGFAPICRGLKFNERYVRASVGGDRRVRRGRESGDLDKGRKSSGFSPNLRERRTRTSRESPMSSPDHSNEYLFPPMEDTATHTTASTLAEQTHAQPATEAAAPVAKHDIGVNERRAANEVDGPSAQAKP